jgi:glycerol kinase
MIASADSFILAIDQGTHASRALVFDRSGQVLAHGEQRISHTNPHPDWVEQDGEEILASVHSAIAQVLRGLGSRAAGIACAGLAVQRSSTICWDRRSGQPLSPLFSWQDRRLHDWIETLRAHGDEVHRRTGLFLSPHYGASKLRWALDHLPAVQRARAEGSLAWGPLASFLVFRMLKERPLLVDPQCAGRTQLWNLQSRDWDPQLMSLFGIPAGFLPHSAQTCQAWGTLASGGLETALTAVNGDQSAAVFAFGWPDIDCAYLNIGTSAFVQRVALSPPGHVPRQLTGIVLADGDTTVYTIEGNVNGAGTALEWLSEQLGESDLIAKLPQWLERPAPALLFLNGIAGLGGPFWQPEFQSRFVGAGEGAGIGAGQNGGAGLDEPEAWQKGVALVESIAFLLQANIDHMAAYVRPPRRIRVSGGVARFDGLCRRIAALNGLPVHRRDDPEASARGIAYLAAGRPAGWNSAAHEDVFSPVPDAGLSARYRRWRELMAQATGV